MKITFSKIFLNKENIDNNGCLFNIFEKKTLPIKKGGMEEWRMDIGNLPCGSLDAQNSHPNCEEARGTKRFLGLNIGKTYHSAGYHELTKHPLYKVN